MQTPWESIINNAGQIARQAVANGGGAFNTSLNDGANTTSTSGFSPVTFGAVTVNFGNGNTTTPTNTVSASDNTPPPPAPFSPGLPPVVPPFGAPSVVGSGAAYVARRRSTSNSSMLLIVAVVLVAVAIKHGMHK